ncbi:MAG: urea ABC transporter permease subunit UrtB, partial [Burkholderiales bacterium]
MRTLLVAAFGFLSALALPAGALDGTAVEKLATGDSDEKLEAIGALVTEGDPRAIAVLEALGAGELEVAGRRLLIVKGGRATDALTGAAVAPLPADREDVVANNRVRGAATAALAALRLVAPERETRLAAAKALAGGADEAMLPLIRKALDKESDPAIKSTLELAAATIELKGGDRERRLAAVRTLGRSGSPSVKTLLLAVLERGKDGAYAELDEEIRREAQASLRAVEGRLGWGEWLGLAFAGVSLGSILLLAALGLAITYGLMGVINMAHGELIMIGAYATYV